MDSWLCILWPADAYVGGIPIKDELDLIYTAFSDYIKEQVYFDILYSEKVGYLQIVTGDLDSIAPEVLDTPEKMLRCLFHNIICDVIFSSDNFGNGQEEPSLTPYVDIESRRRITAILETMEEVLRIRCLNFMNDYFKKYPVSCAEQKPHKDE